MKNSLELPFRFSKKAFRNEWDSLWFKRPFWFDREKATGFDLFKRVLKYLYHDTYDFSIKRYKGTSGTSGKTYQEYEALMVEERPFKLFLRCHKKIERSYHKIETDFDKEVEIMDDKKICDLLEELEVKDLSDCEIDVKFSGSGLHNYSTDRLRKFTEKESKKKWKYDEEKTEVTLNQCFQVFEEPELLEKGNEWYCPNCKDHKLATKELTIYKAP